jgi:hypothetical protein
MTQTCGEPYRSTNRCPETPLFHGNYREKAEYQVTAANLDVAIAAPLLETITLTIDDAGVQVSLRTTVPLPSITASAWRGYSTRAHRRSGRKANFTRAQPASYGAALAGGNSARSCCRRMPGAAAQTKGIALTAIVGVADSPRFGRKTSVDRATSPSIWI